MDYRSPIPVLKYAGVDVKKIDSGTLLKVQKRLLVELELSGSSALLIDGQSFTKDDILTLIDSLKETQQIVFHEWIYQNPSLLSLLSRGAELEGASVLFVPDLRYRKEFKEFCNFISPYLYQPLGKALNQAFMRREFVRAGKLLNGRELIVDSFYDETFGKLKHSVKSLASEIKQNEREVEQFKPANFEFIDKLFIGFLNRLPDDFVPLREELVVNLISLSVKIQRTEIPFCFDLYECLILVKCSESTYEVIQKNHKVFEGRSKTNYTKKQDKVTKAEADADEKRGYGCLKLFFYFLIFFVIMRTCTSTCGSKVKSDRDFRSEAFLADVSTSERDHTRVKAVLKKLTIAEMKSDSLAKRWATLPANPQPDAWPYAAVCKNMKDYNPQKQKRFIFFSNKSEYSTVIFIVNKSDAYSFFLDKGKTIETVIGYNDNISIYPGNEWTPSARFTFKPFLKDRITLNGVFAKTDSTTLLYLDNHFKCKYTAIAYQGKLEVTLTSPVKESLKLSYPDGTFEMVDDKDGWKESKENSEQTVEPTVEEVVPDESISPPVEEKLYDTTRKVKATKPK